MVFTLPKFGSVEKAKPTVVFSPPEDAYTYKFAYSMISLKHKKHDLRVMFQIAQGWNRMNLSKFNQAIQTNEGYESVSVYAQNSPAVHHYGGMYILSRESELTPLMAKFVCEEFAQWMMVSANKAGWVDIYEGMQRSDVTLFVHRDPFEWNEDGIESWR
jgi:hypothetical protein